MYGILSLSASIQIHASSGKTLTRSIDTPARPALTTNACLKYFARLTYGIYWHLFSDVLVIMKAMMMVTMILRMVVLEMCHQDHDEVSC